MTLLYSIPEKCGEGYRCPDKEDASPDEHHDVLGDSVFARVHLDIDLQGTHDDYYSSYRIAQIDDIEHQGDGVVVCRCKCVRSPAVVHIAAFGMG